MTKETKKAEIFLKNLTCLRHHIQHRCRVTLELETEPGRNPTLKASTHRLTLVALVWYLISETGKLPLREPVFVKFRPLRRSGGRRSADLNQDKCQRKWKQVELLLITPRSDMTCPSCPGPDKLTLTALLTTPERLILATLTLLIWPITYDIEKDHCMKLDSIDHSYLMLLQCFGCKRRPLGSLQSHYLMILPLQSLYISRSLLFFHSHSYILTSIALPHLS